MLVLPPLSTLLSWLFLPESAILQLVLGPTLRTSRRCSPTTMDDADDGDNKKRKKEEKSIYSMFLKSVQANTDQNRVSCPKEHLQTSEEICITDAILRSSRLSLRGCSHTMGMAVAGEWPLWH